MPKKEDTSQMYIDADTIIKSASLIGALTALGGVVFWWFKFLERNKKQDQELSAIRKEQTLICYGILACLRGLEEQGCDGPVHEALDKLEKHLNKAAHDEES